MPVPIRAGGLLVFLTAAAAHATPVVDEHVGGVVFVGPTSPSVSAIFWNPAAASLMKGFHALIEGGVSASYTTLQRDTIDSSDGEPNPNGDTSFPSTSGASFAPSGFAGFVWDLGVDRVTLGLGFYTPYADSTPNGDGKNVGYHSLGGFFYGGELNISTSFRVNSQFAIGGGLIFVMSHVDLEFFRDLGLESCSARPCGVENPANAQRFDLQNPWIDLSSSLKFNLGVLLNISSWVFGASFTSPVTAETNTDVTVQNPGVATPAYAGARVSYRLPLMLNVGARHALFGDTELIINGRYLALSSQQVWDLRFFGPNLGADKIPDWIERYRGMSDVFALEVGVEQPPTRSVRLGARMTFETSAVPSGSVAWDQVDAPKLELAGGAQLHLAGGWSLSLGLSLTGMLPISAAGGDFAPSAFITCNASGLDLDACAAVREGRAIPTNAGTYTRYNGVLTVGLAYDTW